MKVDEQTAQGFATPVSSWTAAHVQFQAAFTNADGSKESPKVNRYDANQILGGVGCVRVLFSPARIATVLCDVRIFAKGVSLMLIAFGNQVGTLGLKPRTGRLPIQPWSLTFEPVRGQLYINRVVRPSERTEPTELKTLAEFLSASLIFVLALYVSTAASRWWEMRKSCLGGLWGAIDDLCMWSAAWFASGSASDVAAQRLVRRYGLLSHALLYKEARQEAEQLDDVIQAGLLLEHEAHALQPLASKPAVVWAWMTHLWTRLLADELGTTSVPHAAQLAPMIMQRCMQGRGAIGTQSHITAHMPPTSGVGSGSDPQRALSSARPPPFPPSKQTCPICQGGTTSAEFGPGCFPFHHAHDRRQRRP